MSSDYSYDEKGQFFPFFILTVSAIVTIPLTYSLLKPNSDPSAAAPRIQSDFVPELSDLIDVQRKKQKRRERRLKRTILVIGGWALMALMAYLIVVTAQTIPKRYNPYDILGISESANEKQIKSHYRKMSLKFHPDKIRPDPAKNITAESLNDYFVELTKAYKALTDEEIRNNYVQFGHPDGKQSYSIGIALPKFFITEGNGKYVLLVYSSLLGVLLPYLVGKWWYGTLRMTKEKILVESANNLFREYEEDISEGGVISSLSCGAEFKEVLTGAKADSGLAKLESRILSKGNAESGDYSPSPAGMSSNDQRALQWVEGGIRRKALGLLWAYLGRVDLNDRELDEAKYEVAPIAHALNESFTVIALEYRTTAAILASYHTSQNLIQALPPHFSPLLQLPHITPEISQRIEGNSKTHITLQQYMALPESKRRSRSVGKGLLTESQYQTATTVASQIPHLQVAKAFFKVTGEKVITPGSLVSFVVKGRFVPPGARDVPEIVESDLEDVDPDEADLDAILGRKKKVMKNGKLVVEQQKPVAPPFAHAPYYARDYSPRWHVFLTDSKQGKMAVPPFTFTLFEKPIFKDSASGQKLEPTFNMQTLKANFQAPAQAGSYTFVMHLICDSYVGMDTKMEVTLVVDEQNKAENVQEEDEISEPDEDSLAGQMQVLKTGQVPAGKKKTKQESSDEESNTEGSAADDDDDGDTDTDTDEE